MAALISEGVNFPLKVLDTLIDKSGELLWKLERIIFARGEPYVQHPGHSQMDLESPFNYQLYPATRNIVWWEHIQNDCKEMPIIAEFQREAYRIGVAVNVFRFKDNSLPLSYGQILPQMLLGKQMLAHWGVYIQKDTVAESPSQIFGMNFNHARSELLLEQVWGTRRGWAKEIMDDEFQKIDGSRYRDVTIYCSMEEFILRAQMILKHVATPIDAYLENPERRQLKASAYQLTENNCQPFSKALIEHVIYNSWTDPQRMEKPFTFGDMSSQVISWQEIWRERAAIIRSPHTPKQDWRKNDDVVMLYSATSLPYEYFNAVNLHPTTYFSMIVKLIPCILIIWWAVGGWKIMRRPCVQQLTKVLFLVILPISLIMWWIVAERENVRKVGMMYATLVLNVWDVILILSTFLVGGMIIMRAIRGQ